MIIKPTGTKLTVGQTYKLLLGEHPAKGLPQGFTLMARKGRDCWLQVPGVFNKAPIRAKVYRESNMGYGREKAYREVIEIFGGILSSDIPLELPNPYPLVKDGAIPKLDLDCHTPAVPKLAFEVAPQVQRNEKMTGLTVQKIRSKKRRIARPA